MSATSNGNHVPYTFSSNLPEGICQLAGIRSKRDLHKALHGGENGNDMLQASAIVGWLLGSGILPEYRLAAELQLELGDPED